MKIRAILVCIALLFFCSCGQTNNPQEQAQPTEKASINPNLKDGGVIGLCTLRPDTFNPLFTQYAENRALLSLVFDSLITLSKDFRATPSLAQEWIISEQGKRLSVMLRKNVKWHDGSGFSADDVEYTFNQLLGNTKKSDYRDRLENIESIKKNGNYGVEITLKSPQAGFVNLLDFPIIKKGTTVGEEGVVSIEIPSGTGRYKIESYSQLKSMKLTANTIWWGEEKPHIPIVQVSILPDYDSIMYSFNSRIIDVATIGNNEMSKYSVRDGAIFSNIPTNEYFFVGINLNNPLFINADTRKALSTAVDQETLVKDVLMEFGVSTTQPVNPLAWFSTPQNEKKGVQEARQKLEIEGWQTSQASGLYEKKFDKKTVKFSFDLLVNADNAQKCSIADYISIALAPCGIKVNVKKVAFEEYQRLISGGAFDAFVGSVRIGNDYDLSALIGTNGSLNYGHFSNEDIDKAIKAVNATQTQDEYATAFAQLQKLFFEQQPHIPLAFGNKRLVYDPTKVDGEIATGFTSQYQFLNKWYAK